MVQSRAMGTSGLRTAVAAAGAPSRGVGSARFFLLTIIEPQGVSHGELNQPSPQFQMLLAMS